MIKSRNTLVTRDNSDNPDLPMLGYNDNTIRIQKMYLVLIVIPEGDTTKEKSG